MTPSWEVIVYLFKENFNLYGNITVKDLSFLSSFSPFPEQCVFYSAWKQSLWICVHNLADVKSKCGNSIFSKKNFLAFWCPQSITHLLVWAPLKSVQPISLWQYAVTQWPCLFFMWQTAVTRVLYSISMHFLWQTAVTLEDLSYRSLP